MTSYTVVECRVEYAVGTGIFLLRWFSRWKTNDFNNWSWDELFAFSAWTFYTLIYAMVEFLAVVGALIALSQEQREARTDSVKSTAREGAKAMFASSLFLIFMIWSLKGCIIVLFLRLTRDTRLHAYVWLVAAISVVLCTAAVVIQIVHCLPLRKNWQILPHPGRECSTGIIINIAIASGNVITNILLLAIPILILRENRTALWRKAKIGFLLSLGISAIGMAIARCILSIRDPVQLSQTSVWAQREAIFTIFAVNAPVINALFKAETWRSSRSRCGCRYRCRYASESSASRRDQHNLNQITKHSVFTMFDMEMDSKGSKDSSADTCDNIELPNADNSYIRVSWRISIQGGQHAERVV